jgi:hypothetical protein
MHRYKRGPVLGSTRIQTTIVDSIIGSIVTVSLMASVSSPTLAALEGAVPKDAGSVTFNPPRGGAPRQTIGGASRGDVACSPGTASQQEQPFTALIPTSNYGLTLSHHPTFLAYIPPTSAQTAFFTLKDESGQVQYQSTFPIPTNGGIVRFTLPTTTPGLEAGKLYQWGMAILCTGRLRPDSPFISSWIKRTQPSTNLTNQLAIASPLNRAAAYGANGIWYDTLATLAELRTQKPDNSTLTSIWQKLLESAELGRVAQAPLFN